MRNHYQVSLANEVYYHTISYVFLVPVPEESFDQDPQSMDEILDTIFFYLCQRKAKSYELPLLASHFYTIMQDCVPGLTLDMKLSSHKKFSKFLQHQQQINNLISLEETKPGVLAISSFNLTDNEQLGRFRTPSWLKNYLTRASNSAAAAESEHPMIKYTFPTITELWKTNSRVNELLGCSSSTNYLRADEVRQAVRSYVTRNNLNSEKQVKLDPILARIFKIKDDSSMLVGWNELNSAVFDAMSTCTELLFVHLEQPIRINGHIQPIELECIDRNRKRQTFIRHLDIYQIDLSELCKRIRQGASVSAIINDADETKRTGRVVMAQGNQISFITRLLKDDYGVPSKYIREI
jgi:translation initiation factor 2D